MAKETVTVTIELSILEAAKKAAQSDNRSLSNFIEVVLMTALEKQGT